MKNIYSILSCLILTGFLFSCGSNNSQVSGMLYAEIGDEVLTPEELPLTEIAESITVIPLETSDNLLLQNIFTQITKYGILVQSQELFLFDFDGKFIRKIVQKGPAPHEVAFISDCFAKDDLIYVVCGEECKVFDFEGVFKSAFLCPVYPSGMTVGADDKFVAGMMGIGHTAKSRLAFFSQNSLIKELSRPYSTEGQYTHMLGNESTFKMWNDKLYMKEILNDTIYQVDCQNDTIHPVLAFDFGKYLSNPRLRYTTPGMEELFVKMPMTYFIGINDSYVFLFTRLIDMQRQMMAEATVWYHHPDKQGGIASFYYTDEQIEQIQRAMSGFSPEQMRTFVPMTMSDDGKYLVAYIYPESDENPAVVLAELKR